MGEPGWDRTNDLLIKRQLLKRGLMMGDRAAAFMAFQLAEDSTGARSDG
jgi:hypothetical protein